MPKKTKAVKVTDVRGEKSWLKKKHISKYPVETLSKKKTFLIVCEGQCEELYFKSFPVVSAIVKPVPLGCSKTTLVECTQELVYDETFDEIWCVFDMDYKPDVKTQYADFNKAIDLAYASGFNCAYSNDAFELWYVLHYQFVDQEHPRQFYFRRLSDLWNMNYEKNGKTKDFAKTVYALLENDSKASQKKAIEYARSLYEKLGGLTYHKQNPVTLVYKLVESLNEHIRE